MITATYADDLSRVRLAVASAPANADYTVFERSTDQVNWAVVRGGDTVGLSGGACSLDDYEFAPGVANYYRATYVDTGPTTHVNTSAAVTGNNASVTPTIPAGVQPGDLLLILASIRNSGTGTVNTPTGWAKLVDAGNVALLGRRYVTGDIAPTVTFTGGVANADTLAQMDAYGNCELVPLASNTQLNASAQNIAYPALTVTQANCRIIVAGWKQDDWTSVATLPNGYTENGEIISTAGDDAAMVWDRIPQTTATNIPAGAFTVTGGAAAISRGMTVAFEPAAYVTRDTVTITPGMTRIWLKNPRRPNLNTSAFAVTDFSTITRPARAGIVDVIGRTMPVAVTDVRGSRRYTLTVTTVDLGAADELDARLAQGDPILVHAPGGVDCPIPTMYAVVGDIDIERHSARTKRRFFQLPLTEVAAPPGTVYSQTATYADILTAYATYTALLAGEPTYSDVLDYIAPASDVVVP